MKTITLEVSDELYAKMMEGQVTDIPYSGHRVMSIAGCTEHNMSIILTIKGDNPHDMPPGSVGCFMTMLQDFATEMVNTLMAVDNLNGLINQQGLQNENN